MSLTPATDTRPRVDPARVRAQRIRVGLSKSKAVAVVGVNFKTVWLWEAPDRAPFFPRDSTLAAFARAYQCAPEAFFIPTSAEARA